jgi:glyoxylate/hydroxypyruvate reductase A
MALLINGGRAPAEEWVRTIQPVFPDLEIRLYPEVGNRDDITYLLTTRIPKGEVASFPNLRFVALIAAGVDRILADPELPPDIPVIANINMQRGVTMAEWVLYHLLRHNRRFDLYEADKADHRWELHPYPSPDQIRVGVMGLGTLSGHVARTLRDLQYDVAGWTRTPKDIEGIETFAGADGFGPFLARSDTLIAILPDTPETRGLLDADALARLPKGAYVMNCGRGTLIDEAALIAAIDSGHLSGAALDVFQTEPLPPDDPLWDHPKISITPHNCCIGRPEFGCDMVIENIRRDLAGEHLVGVLDRARGY